MLLWRVMIDGTPYQIGANQDIQDADEIEMEKARRTKSFSMTASETCRRYLLRTHGSEGPLVHQICDILQLVLSRDPSARPESGTMMQQLGVLLNERYCIGSLNPPGFFFYSQC